MADGAVLPGAAAPCAAGVTATTINFRNLDALRGLLAVYVAVGHCRWLLWSGHAAWLGSGYQTWEMVPAYASAALRYGREAVMVFFVLSGFFIHYQAASDISRAGGHRMSTTTFYRRRWHRLAPPYFFALAVTVALDAIGRTWWPTLYLSQTGDALLDQTFARGGYSQASVIPALLVLPSSMGRDFGSNGPLWSLAFEAVYYAIYPAWLWVRRRSAAAAYAGVPIGCVALTFVAAEAWLVTVLAFYPVWLAGAFTAERLLAAKSPPRSLFGVAMFGAGALLHWMSASLAIAVLAAVLYGVGAVVLFSRAARLPRISRAAEFLGLRSYTIYIVHFPLLALMSAFVLHTQGERPLHGWLAVAGAAGCVGFGCLCFEACERFFLHSRYRDESAAP